MHVRRVRTSKPLSMSSSKSCRARPLVPAVRQAKCGLACLALVSGVMGCARVQPATDGSAVAAPSQAELDDRPETDTAHEPDAPRASPSPVPSPTSFPLPVGPYNDDFSGIYGVLAGDPSTGCVWIDAEPWISTQPQGGPTTVVWPPGLRVAFAPLRILDPDGNVIARGGTEIVIGGSGRLMRGAEAGECAVSEEIWLAHHTLEHTISPA